MKINNKTEYDQIKGMLNTMRTLKESRSNIKTNLILEQVSKNIDNDVDTQSTEEKFDNIEIVNKVEIKMMSRDKNEVKLQEDEKKSMSDMIDALRSQVYQLVDLNPGFTIDVNQIRLDGSIEDLDLNFVYIVGDDSGLYINSEMLQVEDETIKMLEKLFDFVETFNLTIEPILSRRLG
jgi:hypothetical protein